MKTRSCLDRLLRYSLFTLITYASCRIHLLLYALIDLALYQPLACY